MEEDFYIYVRSGSSRSHYPLNSTSSFVNYLVAPLDLDTRSTWEVGVCELHMPLKARADVARMLLDEAKQYSEQADETVKFAEELVKDADVKKAAAEDLMKSAKELQERATRELERVDRERRLLDLLSGEHLSRVENQRREAEDHEERRRAFEQQLADFDRERKRLERMQREHNAKAAEVGRLTDEQQRVAKEIEDQRLKLIADRTAFEAKVALELTRERNAQHDLELCKQKQEAAEDRLKVAEQALRDTYTSLRNIQAQFERLKPAPAPPPPPRRPLNQLRVDGGGTISDFPVYLHFNLASFLNTVFSHMPSIWRTVVSGQMQNAAKRVLDEVPATGTNPRFKFCGAYTEAVNRIRVRNGELCFPARTYANPEELVDSILYLGCYQNSQLKAIAQELMEELELYFFQTSITVSGRTTLFIPHREYDGFTAIHERILKKITSPEQRLEYARAVYQAVEDDRTLRLVSPDKPYDSGFVFEIRYGRSTVVLPVKQFTNVTSFIAQMRAGTSDQHVVDALLLSWVRLTSPLLSARPKRSTSTHDQQSVLSSDYILVKSDLITLQYYGDSMMRVLRVLPYPRESSASHFTFTNVYYHTVSSHWIHSIRIELSDGHGHSFPEAYFDGECIVLLHIRKRRYYHHERRPVNCILPSTG